MLPSRAGFKPSTNFKTIQLLKTYVCYNEVTQSDYVTSSPTGKIRCILLNASWTLQWLWGQREIDEEFIMAVVSTKNLLGLLELLRVLINKNRLLHGYWTPARM